MKTFCHYHPTRPAHWNCAKCQTTYCSNCIVERDRGNMYGKETIRFCPKCNLPTECTGIGNIIDPFWNRLPKFFTYALSPRPLALIVVLSLASLLFSGSTFFNLIMRVLIWGLLFKYSFSALKATAQGDLVPPEVNSQTLLKDFSQVFKQSYIYIAIGILCVVFIYSAGPAIGGLFLLFAMLLLPAMIILLVATNSLLHALNPAAFIQLALRIGWGYLLMYFFLLLLGGGPAFIEQYGVDHLHPVFHLFIFTFLTNFYTIISYHLMGYVILQYHETIGYQVDYDDFRESSAQMEQREEDNENSLILNRLNVLIQEGKLDEALAFLKDETQKGNAMDLALSERYFNLLKMQKQTHEMLEHGVTYLNLLAQENKKDKACEIYSECLSETNEFTPTSFSLFKLGGWLNETGKFKEAIAAYNKLVKVYPNDSLAPKTYFRAAQIFQDRFMNPSKATKILTGLVKKYPDHEVIPQVMAYLGHIQPQV